MTQSPGTRDNLARIRQEYRDELEEFANAHNRAWELLQLPTPDLTAEVTEDLARLIRHADNRITAAEEHLLVIKHARRPTEEERANFAKLYQKNRDLQRAYAKFTATHYSTIVELTRVDQSHHTIETTDHDHILVHDHPEEMPDDNRVNDKAIQSLKLPLLKNSYTAVELAVWIESFSDWFKASRLDKLSAASQRPFFRNAIDPAIWAAIKSTYAAAQEVLGDANSGISALQAYFKRTNPIFKRRMEFFASQPAQLQPISEWMAHLEALRVEADIAALNSDGFMVHKVISAPLDEDLKSKLLRIDNPTLRQVYDEVYLFERAKSALPARGHQPPIDTGQANAVHPRFQARRCKGCGGSHSRNECPHKNTTCHHCKKTGHIQTACLAKKRGETTSQPQQSRNNRNSQNAKRPPPNRQE